MGAVKMYRDSSLPSPGTMAADQVRYVKVGSSYIQYVIDNSGVAIPPAVMAHTHNIADVTGLQTALDGKSDTGHTHANATITVPGFMSAADKVKLDGLSNYTHPNSGVAADTYRSVTVDAMGHVTAGTNPNTLAGYGITQRYVSLDPTDGFPTPVQSTYDLNTAALTAYGYATTATNRPTGTAANGYFSTNSVNSTSFFQTFANPTVQDAFFYRRRNTSTNYAWLQVASREWVATQISGTVNQVPLFTGTNTLGDSILSQSGINVTAAGQFVSDVAPSGSGSRGFGFFASGSARWTIGKFGLETGSNAGSNLVFYRFNDVGGFLGEAMSINRATGNVVYSGTITASGGNSTQWNAAVPSSRTITINGTTFDLSANRSWTVAGGGGVGGSGTTGFVPSWVTGSTLGNSSINDSDVNYLNISKAVNFGQDGSRWSITAEPNSGQSSLIFYNPALNGGYQLAASLGGMAFVQIGGAYIMSFLSSGNVQVQKQFESALATGTAPFLITSTTMSPNLNADMVDGLHASSFALASSLSGYVPTSRTITINGTTFDLSANRSWTVSGSIGGSGTTGRLSKFSASTTLADSILSESGISITANGGIFVSDTPTNSNVRGFSILNGGVTRWTFGKAGTESGSDSGSDFTLWSFSDAGAFIREPLRISRATGNAAFSGSISASGGNSGNWNTAYGWGNHASAGYALNSALSGYVPTSRTITINGTTYDLSANRSWTISGGSSYSASGGIGLSGTTFFVNAGTGLYQDSDGLSIDLVYADGRYIQQGTSTIQGVQSITGGGPIGSGIYNLSLVNDSSSPGVNMLYGTNGSGTKGWYSQPSGGGGGVSGSGTSGYLAMWNGSGSITNSSIFDFGGYMVVSKDLIIQDSKVFKVPSGTASVRSGHTIYGAGQLFYQTDGTQGLYVVNASGSWVLV